MRHFTKDEQKKYTESISKLYKPTGGSIMADKINDKLKRERKSYEERMKEAAEEKALKEAKLETGNLIKEVMNSDMNDDVKVEIIKRLAQKQETVYIPYVQSPANWWESRPTYVSAPTTGDPIENQPHTVCSDCKTSISVPNKTCPECNGRGMVQIGGYGSGVKGLEKCEVCDGKGYVGYEAL